VSPTDSHMHDFEAHVRAVEEDFEYYRTKRLEPRVLFLVRRGKLRLSQLLRAGAVIGERDSESAAVEPAAEGIEQRIRALEDRLDEYVKQIALLSSANDGIVIEDTRNERGDYDAFFRIAKRHHEGALEERVAALDADLAEGEYVLRAMRQALLDAGLTSQAELQARRAEVTQPGPWNGARIVARAWVDPEFKQRLIEQGRAAVRELNIPPGRLGKLGVAENTDTVHNVVVCTLCSCYPHDLLGDTPWWYKHDSYKQQIVRDPRACLQEMFGLRVPEQTEIRVHDSTSDVRWMVLPARPSGTEGLSEAELARLVTRECLIGTDLPRV
jgi:nitrile hydratase subunit alpha